MAVSADVTLTELLPASPVVGRGRLCPLKSKSRPEPQPQLGNFRIDEKAYLSSASPYKYHPLCGTSIAAVTLVDRTTASGFIQTKRCLRNTAQLICGSGHAL